MDARAQPKPGSEARLNENAPPAMSVVLVTPDDYETIRKTVHHLREQTIRERLEIVIVAPAVHDLGLAVADFEDFRRFHVIEFGTIRSTGAAIAAGVAQASAPIVAYAEEHSYPEPGWAAALIEAHRNPWAGVGAVLANANPECLTSWANFFLDFGPWMAPAAGGQTDRLPWHHTSYKRSLLVGYGQRLAGMLETEGILHADLRTQGYRLYLEPAAKARHVNLSRLSSFVRGEFHGGRLFGAARARHGRWSALRRLLYAGGSPFVPLLRAPRVLRDIHRAGRQRELVPRVLPLLMIGLIAHSIGEAAGYVLSAGMAAQRRCSFELNRYRHVAPGDRQRRDPRYRDL
jgi:hypothetical protein